MGDEPAFSHQQLVDMAQGDEKLKLLEEAIHSRNVSTDFAQTTAKNEIYIRNVKRKYLTIASICMAALVLVALMAVVDVFLRFGDVVSMFDHHKAAYMPSGFELGLALRVPALTSWLGFKQTGLPNAVYISFKSVTMHDAFMKAPAANLEAMWGYAQFLGGGADATGDPSALDIVCNSWAYAAGVTSCEQACSPGSGAYASDYVSDGIQGVTQIAMMSEMGPVAMGVSAAMSTFGVMNTAGLLPGESKPGSHCVAPSKTGMACVIM